MPIACENDDRCLSLFSRGKLCSPDFILFAWSDRLSWLIRQARLYEKRVMHPVFRIKNEPVFLREFQAGTSLGHVKIDLAIPPDFAVPNCCFPATLPAPPVILCRKNSRFSCLDKGP